MASTSTVGEEPPSKKRKLSLSLNRKKKSKEDDNIKRFLSPVKDDVFREAAKGVIPENTKKSNTWAINVFHSWMEARNLKSPQDPIPEDILQRPDPSVLSKFLRYFILEVRREDGSNYPPATIRNLLSGINRVLKENGMVSSIFNKEDPVFREFLLTLDSVSSNLHCSGVGANRVSASIILLEHENVFWEKEIMGYESPKSLFRAVFFSVGMHFVLRGVDEQHNLKPTQIMRFPSDKSIYLEDTYYEYTEYISKNNMHRYKDINSSNKSVRVFAKPGNQRCVVRLLDFYLTKLPPEPPAFYLRPLQKIPHSLDKPWYARAPIGVNTLKNVLPDMCSEAEIGVRYTNHSLRATAITRMYQNGVPEKLISEKSGHRSLKGLRAYEKTSLKQEKAVDHTISSDETFVEEQENIKIEKKEEKKSPLVEQVVQHFSGLQGCTLNFYTKS